MLPSEIRVWPELFNRKSKRLQDTTGKSEWVWPNPKISSWGGVGTYWRDWNARRKSAMSPMKVLEPYWIHAIMCCSSTAPSPMTTLRILWTPLILLRLSSPKKIIWIRQVFATAWRLLRSLTRKKNNAARLQEREEIWCRTPESWLWLWHCCFAARCSWALARLGNVQMWEVQAMSCEKRQAYFKINQIRKLPRLFWFMPGSMTVLAIVDRMDERKRRQKERAAVHITLLNGIQMWIPVAFFFLSILHFNSKRWMIFM